jgi:hypothetical protein
MHHGSINQYTSTPPLFCGPVWSAAPASPCSWACVMVQSISAPALHLYSVVLSGQLLQLHRVPAHVSWFNQSVHQLSASILSSCLVSCSSFTMFLCMCHGSISQCASSPPLFCGPVWSAAPASPCSCACVMVQSISAPALHLYSLVLSGQLLQLHRVPVHASWFNQSVHQHSTSILLSCLVSCSSFTVFLCMNHGSINQCTSTPPLFCGPVGSPAPASPCSCACVMVQSNSAPALHLYSVILSGQLLQLHSVPAHASWFNQSVHQHSTSVLWSYLVSCSSFTVFLRMRHGLINLCTSTPPLFCGPIWSSTPASPCSCACIMVQSISAPALHLYSVVLSGQLLQLHRVPAHASWFNQSVHQHSTSVLWFCMVSCPSFTVFLRMHHGSINQCTSTPPLFCDPVWSAAPALLCSCACIMAQSISAPALHLCSVILSGQLLQLHRVPAHASWFNQSVHQHSTSVL